jgi:hypothetical protein
MNDRHFFRFVCALAALLVTPLSAPAAAADASEMRTVSGFDRIRLQGVFSTEISAGAGRTSVVVSGDPDAVARVTTAVEGGTLLVGMRPGAGSSSRSLKLMVALPVLRGFANEGAGSTNITGLTGADIEITNAGTGSIVAAGRAARETIALNGTGRIDVTGVAAHDVTVDNNGVGSVRVRADGLLTLNVNGIGEIRYAGNPARVDGHVNGVGRIAPL